MDPFAVLGPHATPNGLIVRCFEPGATSIELLAEHLPHGVALERRHPDGFFEGLLPSERPPFAYRLRAGRGGSTWEFRDPYAFSPVLGQIDDHLPGLRQKLQGGGRHLRFSNKIKGSQALWVMSYEDEPS